MPRQPKDYPNRTDGNLFNHIMKKHELKNFAELSALTGIWKHEISRIVNGKRKVGRPNKLDIITTTGLTLKQIDRLIAKEEE